MARAPPGPTQSRPAVAVNRVSRAGGDHEEGECGESDGSGGKCKEGDNCNPWSGVGVEVFGRIKRVAGMRGQPPPPPPPLPGIGCQGGPRASCHCRSSLSIDSLAQVRRPLATGDCRHLPCPSPPPRAKPPGTAAPKTRTPRPSRSGAVIADIARVVMFWNGYVRVTVITHSVTLSDSSDSDCPCLVLHTRAIPPCPPNYIPPRCRF